MESTKSTLLIVDDEEFNLEILADYLEDEGYGFVTAEDGIKAWNILESEPGHFDAVLLDRMMPRMDGMEVLARMKADTNLKNLPVILQTAKASKQDVLDGLNAGAYYYLTKPFDKATMLAIVNSAVSDYQRYQSLRKEAEQTTHALSLLTQGQFTFKTLEQGRQLASLLANATTEGDRVVVGLSELLVNAVEHGNLALSYEDKTRLNLNGEWQTEINRRLELPEYAERRVTVTFERCESELRFLIRDQGNGFDWQEYLKFSADRAYDTHGRGIAMANTISFDKIEYRGRGNEVMARIQI